MKKYFFVTKLHSISENVGGEDTVPQRSARWIWMSLFLIGNFKLVDDEMYLTVFIPTPKLKVLIWIIYNTLISNRPSIYFSYAFNTLRLEQIGRYFAGGIFKCIFLNENYCAHIAIAPNFFSGSLINNESVTVQVMAWRRTSEKPSAQTILIMFYDTIWYHCPTMS